MNLTGVARASWPRSIALAAVLAAACQPEPSRTPEPRPSASPCPPTTPSASAPPTNRAEPKRPKDWLALFDALVEKIETLHAFAEAPKARWPSDKVKLREEFSRVQTREQALVALWHLQSALRDRHCVLSPPADMPPKLFSLGFKVFPEVIQGVTHVYVDRVLAPELGAGPSPKVLVGDEIVAVDGVSTAEFLAAHPHQSNVLNPIIATLDQSMAIAEGIYPWTAVKLGQKRTLRLLRNGKEHDVTIEFARPSQWAKQERGARIDDAPPMASVGCRPNEKGSPYAEFELSAVGANLCVYKPKTGNRNTRLVRYTSFNYVFEDDELLLRRVRGDHDLLARELSGAKAVVIDLHENLGGNNDYVFLSWFAQKPWDHQIEVVRVSSGFSDSEVESIFFHDPHRVSSFRAAVSRGDKRLLWPFHCNRGGKRVLSGTCANEGPWRTELVTTAPVAIVTGPLCASACDGFATTWSRFGLGPVVGQQPAHGFTGSRYAFPIVGPDGSDLGTFRLALSWSNYDGSDFSFEGQPIKMDWEAPSTFATRKTWVDAAIREARARVEAPR